MRRGCARSCKIPVSSCLNALLWSFLQAETLELERDELQQKVDSYEEARQVSCTVVMSVVDLRPYSHH